VEGRLNDANRRLEWLERELTNQLASVHAGANALSKG
jgi:CO dehydrogenase/acetyl-CoA synthase alpha subunit